MCKAVLVVVLVMVVIPGPVMVKIMVMVVQAMSCRDAVMEVSTTLAWTLQQFQ